MLDRQSALPLHSQFENILRNKIESEELSVNSRIPSENELCKIYGISRMTVRSVLGRLVDEGLLLLYRVQGKGTFVAEPKIISGPLVRYGFREQLEQQEYETRTKLVSFEKNAALLNLNIGSHKDCFKVFMVSHVIQPVMDLSCFTVRQLYC